MITAPLSLPIFREFDNSGLMLAGGKLYTYYAGGTTPKATYSDVAGAVPNANPVVLDTTGRANVRLGSGSYHFVLKDAAGNSIWDVDYENAGLNPYYDITPAETLAGVTPVNYAVPSHVAFAGILLERYVTNTTPGTTDMSPAWSDAISVQAQCGAPIVLLASTYNLITPQVIAASYAWVLGQGSGASTIKFSPTGNGTALKWSNGASMIVGGGIKGVRFTSSDSTYTKIAINHSDCDQFHGEDVVITGTVNVGGNNFWSGAGSIGLQTNGRDQTDWKKLYIFADKPIHIAKNPNATQDADHYHFQDLYLGANGNPIWTVDSGVNLTNFLCDGYQAWVLGTDGFKWVDTTGVNNGYNISFKNVRGEQGSNTASWLFDIEHHTNCQGIKFENVCGGNDRNMFKFRNCQAVQLDRCFGNTSARVVLDIDSSIDGIGWDDCLWVSGSTTSIAGQNLIYATQKISSTDPLNPTARYASTVRNALRGFVLGDAFSENTFSLANNAVSQYDQAMCGIWTIVTDEGNVGTFGIRGANHVVDVISDAAGVFSNTGGAGAKTNVFWSAGNSAYEIENKRGSTRKYKISLAGSYVAL